MPELPEVETILRGLEPHLHNAKISEVIVRHYQLRWPIMTDLANRIRDERVVKMTRRAKYLLFHLSYGTLIIHLGMSGRLHLLTHCPVANKHDHLDFVFNSGHYLRYTDPRRFGAVLWTPNDPNVHPLLKNLGVEPLSAGFTPEYLFNTAEGRRIPLKSFIMSNQVVVGVGNIYATEALYLAKLDPRMPAGALTITQAMSLVKAIVHVLTAAIDAGGTSLKDFVDSEGRPGYFSQQLKVYGRAGLPCLHCKTPLEAISIGQRNTVFCAVCQR